MSHYTVAVITKDGDYDKALAPFDEGIEVPPYVRETKDEIINSVIEKKKYYDDHKDVNREWFDKNYGHVDFNDRDAIHKAYCELFDDEEYDEEGNRLSTYNPKSKWDWYSLGGRWGGSLKLKENQERIKESDGSWTNGYQEVERGYTDHAQVKHIDFTQDEADYKAGLRWWEVVVEGSSLKEGEDEDEFRTFYKKEYYIEKFGDKETYAKSRGEFGTYALLYHGEWIEPGQMGWFGCDDSTADSNKAYREKFKEIMDNLDPEDYISVIDCHI